MNKGVMMASGDWIGFLNAGDVYSSSFVLSNLFENGDTYVGVDVIYGNAVEIDGNKQTFYRGTDNPSDILSFPAYRHGASFVRRQIHRTYLFDLSLSKKLVFSLDYHQIHRMYVHGCVFKKVNITILDFEKEGISNSPWLMYKYNYMITRKMDITFYDILLLGIKYSFRKSKNKCSHLCTLFAKGFLSNDCVI